MPGKVTDDPVLIFRRAAHDSAEPPRTSRKRQPERVHNESSTAAAPIDTRNSVRRLYTVAMMADVLSTPVAAVRHWVRGSLLVPVKRARGIEWFDFAQLVVGRMLARLLASGLSLREIDAKLGNLTPKGAGDAAQHCASIITDGRRLSMRRGGHVLGAHGQMQFRFYTDSLDGPISPYVLAAPVAPCDPSIEIDVTDLGGDEPIGVNDLVNLAADLEAAGEFTEATEALRAALQAAGPDGRISFMLAELLYRAGDLTAARERYYATIELDAEHLEARTSLGCVLAELGEHELAVAAFEGVLRQQPDYADAYWHMAGVLEEADQPAQAREYLREFLLLAPESPWAALARERLQ